MSQSVSEKSQFLSRQMGESSDLNSRVFQTSAGQQGALLFLTGLTDLDKIDRLLLNSFFGELKEEITIEEIKDKFPLSDIQWNNDTNHVLQGILSGKTALILEHIEGYFLLGLRKWAQRSPEHPIIDNTVKGSQEGFVETLTVNISLIRRFLKSPSLRVEEMTIGKLSETRVSMLYVDGIAQTEVINEVRHRLKQIETDVILASSNIEQWIEDNSMSLFPLVRLTERPDVTVASLVEGKVAILTDQSPFALVVPFTFFDSLQNMDDYFEKWQIGILFRLIRFIAFTISFLLPGLYVSLAHYNPGLIPTELLLSMITTLTNVPFPLVVELLFMELSIEIFREAGMRLPQPVGQTIGIVGGIVIGDAAVQANLVSPATLIVVALTAMASYSAPLYSLAHTFRMLRFLLILIAGFLGLYGYVLAVLVILGHLASLKSFGVPYLSPMAPALVADWVDHFLIFPQRWRNRRPAHLTQSKKIFKRKPLKEG